jgi:hypothetical protein
MKRKTRLKFLGNLDLMMNLVVKWDFGGGACGNGGGSVNRMIPTGRCRLLVFFGPAMGEGVGCRGVCSGLVGSEE